MIGMIRLIDALDWLINIQRWLMILILISANEWNVGKFRIVLCWEAPKPIILVFEYTKTQFEVNFTMFEKSYFWEF